MSELAEQQNVAKGCVYLITASQGYYSARKFWVVTWRATRLMAEALRRQLQFEADDLYRWRRVYMEENPRYIDQYNASFKSGDTWCPAKHEAWVTAYTAAFVERTKELLYQPKQILDAPPTFEVHECLNSGVHLAFNEEIGS